MLDCDCEMTDKLHEICATKREEVAARKAAKTIADCDRSAQQSSPPSGFRSALEEKSPHGFALIAEIKKASPPRA